MSGRIISPTDAPASILRGSGVWAQAGTFSARVSIGGLYVVPYDIQPLAGGGSIIAAGVNVAGVQRAALIRMNPGGSVAWCSVLSVGASVGALYRVRVTPSGGFVFAGRQDNAGTGNQNLLIGSASSSGAVAWTSTWDGGVAALDAPCGLAVDAAGNVYASIGDSGLTTALFKLNAVGAVQWQRSINWGTNTRPQFIELDAAGATLYTGAGYAGELGGFSTATGATVGGWRYLPSAALNNARFRGATRSGSTLYMIGDVNPGGALGAGIVACAVDLNTMTLVWDRHLASSTAAASGLGCWQPALAGGVLYGAGNAAGLPDNPLQPFALNAATGALSWLDYLTRAGDTQALSACAVGTTGVWLGWSDSGAPWGGGAVSLLPSSGSWPATLASWWSVSIPAVVSSVPGSTLPAVAWGNGPGTFTSSGLALTSSSPSITSTVYPVS